MIQIEIKFFGAFRKYEKGRVPLFVNLQEPITVEEVKLALKEQLGDPLIDDSALANETRVLSAKAVLTSSCSLSLLPPVCGG
jgi:molybdopterin converting factor small subunit